MKPVNKRDNDWFFDSVENRINKGLDIPKKTIFKGEQRACCSACSFSWLW